jgi:hypothetical protein
LANRLLLGLDGGAYKFRISKPTFNVLTTPDVNLLISDTANDKVVQTMLSGSFVITGSNVDNIPFGITFPAPPVVAIQVVSYDNGEFEEYASWPRFNYFFRSFTDHLEFDNDNTVPTTVLWWAWSVVDTA